MKTALCAMVAVGIVASIPASGRGADREAALAVVEKGIKAAGGTEALKKLQAYRYTEKGSYFGMNDEGVPYTSEGRVAFPDKYRMEVTGVFTIVLNGNKGWIKTADGTRELDAEQLAHQKEELYASHVGTLLPLRNQAYGLEVVGEVTVDRRKCTQIKVTQKNHNDVLLDFDNETGLLSRMKHRTWSDEQKKEVDQEITMRDYEDKAGAHVATRFLLKRDGKMFVEAQIQEYAPLEKTDDSQFAAP